MTLQTAFAVVVLLVGVLLISASIAPFWPVVKLYISGQRTTGTLLRWRHTFFQKFHRSGLEVRQTRFYPIVSFRAADGSEHTVEGATGHETRDWPAGHSVLVRYDASDPSHASFEGVILPWKFQAIALVAGVALVLAAILH